MRIAFLVDNCQRVRVIDMHIIRFRAMAARAPQAATTYETLIKNAEAAQRDLRRQIMKSGLGLWNDLVLSRVGIHHFSIIEAHL
jgi:hypothetical protein